MEDAKHKFICCLFCLPFLPAEQIQLVFVTEFAPDSQMPYSLCQLLNYISRVLENLQILFPGHRNVLEFYKIWECHGKNNAYEIIHLEHTQKT